MIEEDTQIQVFHQRERLDDEIDEMWKLMQRSSKRRYGRKRNIDSLEEQLTIHIYISKAYGGLHIKIWDPGGLRIKFKCPTGHDSPSSSKSEDAELH